MEYLDISGIKKVFGEHLMMHLGYSPEEVAIAVSDFPDVYSNCYLAETYIGPCEIDGEIYEQYASYTSLWQVVMAEIPEFHFYTFYRKHDIPNHRVSQYQKAKKLYQISDLNEAYFPSSNE